MRLLAALLIAAVLPAPAPAQDQRPDPRPAEIGAEQAPKPKPARPSAEPPPEPVAPPAAASPKPEAGEQPAAPAKEAAPEAGTEGASETEAPQAAATPGPPVHATLREDDFTYSACLLELTMLGADYAEQPPVTDAANRDCGIDRPILLRAPLPGIAIEGGALMRCDMARHLGHWLRDFVRPAAALLPGQPRLVGLVPGSTYQCRATVGNDAGKTSEHSFGTAFDISAFRFDNGETIDVAPRQDDGDLIESFQRAVRGTACLHFTTVLGPGANAAHDNHLHLDIKARKNGYRLCQ